MAVEIKTEPAFAAAKARQLFQGRFRPTSGTVPFYDVSADGAWFLMLEPAEQGRATTEIHVVLNFFEELKRKVPGGGK